MGSFQNSKQRRKVFEGVIQKQLPSKMTLLKCYWVFWYPGTNYSPYFNDMHLSTTQNVMLVPRYGTWLNQHFSLTFATSHRISSSFESREQTLWLMLLNVSLWVLLTVILIISTLEILTRITKTLQFLSVMNSAMKV